MASIKFINLLKELSNTTTLTLQSSNDLVKKFFPNFGNSKLKNLFRNLVKEKITEVPKKNIEEVLKLLNVIYPKLTPNTRTLDSAYSTDVRSQFKTGSDIHKLSKQLLKISYADKGLILKEDNSRNDKKESNRLEFYDKDIFQIIADNINNPDPFRRLVALLLASGSRPIEVVEKSSYIVDPEDPQWVRQSDIAKKKGLTHDDAVKPILFITGAQFVSGVDKLRTDLKNKYTNLIGDNGQISTGITSGLSKTAKDIFGNKVGFTPYSARKIYGSLSYQLYGKSGRHGDNPTLSRWLSAVLGHAKGSISSTNHYSTIEVKQDTPFNEREVAIKVSELEIGLDSLEERFQEASISEINKPIEVKPVKNDALRTLQFKALDKVFDDYVSKNKVLPSSNWLEKDQNGKIPRAVVRLYYTQKKIDYYK